jgi:hypothetical protein
MRSDAESWLWSSYPGSMDPARRPSWIACEKLWQAWRAEFGGDAADAVQTYQHFVNTGIE